MHRQTEGTNRKQAISLQDAHKLPFPPQLYVRAWVTGVADLVAWWEVVQAAGFSFVDISQLPAGMKMTLKVSRWQGAQGWVAVTTIIYCYYYYYYYDDYYY